MRSTINHVGKYQLRAVVGRTASSAVYDGWDGNIARRVAIKLMALSAVENEETREVLIRFKRGAQAAGQLNHPNIVSVFDYGETEDHAYLVMEFVDGPTLKALFDQHRKFALAEIGAIVSNILDALQYSHEHRVVHRDVKPANVMFTKDNVVKITDFGIARLDDSEITQAGMVIGTPAYMSPEQFLGEKIDWRTDVYSVGVLLYQILTGERPYEGTLATIMHKVLHETPLPPSRRSTLVTSALDAVVTRAMAKRREDRFQSAAEFKAGLQKALTPPSARPDPTLAVPAESRTPLRRSSHHAAPRAVIFTSLAAALVVAGGAVAWRFHGVPKGKIVLSDGQPNQSTEIKSVPSPVPPAAQAEPPHPVGLAGETTKVPVTAAPREAAALEPHSVQTPPAQPEATGGYRNDAAERPPLSVAATDGSASDSLYRPVPSAPFPSPPVPSAPVSPDTTAGSANAPPTGALPTKDVPDKRLTTGSGAPRITADNRNGGGVSSNRRPARPESGRGKSLADQANGLSPSVPRDGGLGDDSMTDTLRRLRDGVASRTDQPTDQPTDSPPPIYPTTSSSPVGLLCQSVTAETAGNLGLDRPRGMVVLGVTSGSAAAAAGLRQKDVILKINGAEVSDLSALRGIAGEVAMNQTVPVEILRHGSQRVVQLQVSQLRR